MRTRLEVYQLVASLAGLGIWERNFLTGSVYWNKIIRQILEVPEDYVLDAEMTSVFFKDPKHIQDIIDVAKDTGLPQVTEAEITTAKGTPKWVKLRMQVREENGVSAILYGTLEDITEDVALRQLLEEREQRFSLAFNHAPIGMALVSLAGEWLKVNRSLCTMLGYTEDELLQYNFQQLTHPDDLELDLQNMYRLIDRKVENYSIEKRYFHKDGHIIWAVLNVSLVYDDAGSPQYFVSQIKDITERRKYVEVIRAQNDRLLNFAHIVSHNLRSHAGNIKMLTDTARGEEDTAEREELLEMLSQNADNLLKTLTELNEIVKVHDNGLAHKESVNLKHAIERVAVILSATIKQSHARLQVDVCNDLMVLFNPAYLESVLINLLTNSIKYRHPGVHPRIVISAYGTHDKTILKVADNGIGIDLKLHGHKLFGMYKTFHGNTDARGMGLFLIKNQVEAMGGTISAESRPGEGTTFIVEINKM